MSAEPLATPRTGPYVDRPQELSDDLPPVTWGSDALAKTLRDLGLPFIALNPGASYRGLHDSIVNFLGNDGPSMLVCLHEEHAVAIAHGYAKVSGRPLAVAIHSNVGLMHASMALYNAWCDRVPMVVIGAAGPFAADQRRPWIDWIHTFADQAAMVRPYLKWDDQPASVPAAIESLIRAHQVTTTYPSAPTYVVLDAAMQEETLEAMPASPTVSVARAEAPLPPAPAAAAVDRARALLADSERTVILMGRVGRSEEAWDARLRLAEALDAQVLTDTKLGATFPTRSERHAAVPSALPTPSSMAVLRAATAVLSLDWVDLAGTLGPSFGDRPIEIPVIHCSMDHTLHNGFGKEAFGLVPADLTVQAHPDAFVDALLASGVGRREGASGPSAWTGHLPVRDTPPAMAGDGLTVRRLAAALRNTLGDQPASLVRLPLGWDGEDLDLEHPLDYIGYDGGAGIGSGPGMAVGCAMALMADPRLPVAVLGDGDTLMGATALWTAARHRIPLLVVVANNRSFFNDEQHQERTARRRDRPVVNRWIGQRIDDPAPDLAVMARSLGLHGIGPVADEDSLSEALAEGIRLVRDGETVLIDAHVAVAQYAIDVPKAAGKGAIAERP